MTTSEGGAASCAWSPKLAVVTWSGNVGGAEVMAVTLAAAFHRAGVDVEVIFLTDSGSLGDRLAAARIPFRAVGLRRGRDVLRHPRRCVTQARLPGRDGVLLPECGYLGLALRAGGYQGSIVAVEHGAQLVPATSKTRAALRYLARMGAAWSDDAEVAVSDFMLERMRMQPHSSRTCRIHNAIDPAALTPPTHARTSDGSLFVGFAGRLVPGKGTDHLISAIAQVRKLLPTKLLVAGDGPDRARLESLAQRAGVGSSVEFLGIIDDVGDLWNRCDVAVFPSSSLPESFGLAALEAMSCGKPVVATSVGALPELVVGGTGVLVAPGDTAGLAAALLAYGEDPTLRHRHGTEARRRSIEQFNIDTCARAYLDLFADLSRVKPRSVATCLQRTVTRKARPRAGASE